MLKIKNNVDLKNWKNMDLKEQDIKSIVTKECFESMEYKVKE